MISGDVEFRNNTSSTEGLGYGGAAFLSDYSTLIVTGRASFTLNQALSGSGGAFFLQQEAEVVVSGSVVFSENQARVHVRHAPAGCAHTICTCTIGPAYRAAIHAARHDRHTVPPSTRGKTYQHTGEAAAVCSRGVWAGAHTPCVWINPFDDKHVHI